jgi:hypothetical protein
MVLTTETKSLTLEEPNVTADHDNANISSERAAQKR